MSLPEPMGYWRWLVWNYQGRPDPHYAMNDRTPRLYPYAAWFPGGMRRAQGFDQRMQAMFEAMEWLATREQREAQEKREQAEKDRARRSQPIPTPVYTNLIREYDPDYDWNDHGPNGPWAINQARRQAQREAVIRLREEVEAEAEERDTQWTLDGY